MDESPRVKAKSALALSSKVQARRCANQQQPRASDCFEPGQSRIVCVFVCVRVRPN